MSTCDGPPVWTICLVSSNYFSTSPLSIIILVSQVHILDDAAAVHIAQNRVRMLSSVNQMLPVSKYCGGHRLQMHAYGTQFMSRSIREATIYCTSQKLGSSRAHEIIAQFGVGSGTDIHRTTGRQRISGPGMIRPLSSSPRL